MPTEMNHNLLRTATLKSVQEKIDELDALPPDDPEDSSWELVHHAVKEMKATHFIMLLCSDLEWPRFGRTEEEGWMNLVQHPRICAKIAELRQKQLLRDLRLHAQLGVDGIMPCGDLGSSAGLDGQPAHLPGAGVPRARGRGQRGAPPRAEGAQALLRAHLAGHRRAGQYLRRVRGDPGLGRDGHQAAQGARGRPAHACGAASGTSTSSWAASRTSATTPATRFTHAAPGGGYIMGSTHSLAVDAKRENILEMKRCRDEWGNYPIDPKRFV